MTARTMIEVDPDIVEAEWLRRVAVGASRCVNPAYPEGGITLSSLGVFLTRRTSVPANVHDVIVFDVETLEAAPVKLKFTLADIDEL